jgi:Galactose oxidase, central domain/Kelch motif
LSDSLLGAEANWGRQGYGVCFPRLYNLPPSGPRPPRQKMDFFSRNKRHSKSLSTSASTTSLVTQQDQLPTNPQSRLRPHLPSLRENQKSQPVFPWSAHAPASGKSPSPFPRGAYALSTSPTAAGELFLFGGYVPRSKSSSNDLYVISTRDLSTTLLKTSGDVPSPRHGHRAVLTSTTLLIWGGETGSWKNKQYQSNDDSFSLLNLGTSDLFKCQDPLQLIRAFFVPESREWTRIEVYGPGPGARHHHTMTLIGSKLFVFGGKSVNSRKSSNDIWALDLNCRTFVACFPEPF